MADPFAAAKQSAIKAAEELRAAAAVKAQEIRSAAVQNARRAAIDAWTNRLHTTGPAFIPNQPALP